MKKALLAIMAITVSIISMPSASMGADKGVIEQIDKKIAIYNDNINVLKDRIVQLEQQLELARKQLEQTVGAKFSLEDIKNDLKKKQAEDNAEEAQ